MMESIRSVSESIKGRQRAWIEAGNGPVVVLLHGFPDAPTGFLPQIRALAEAGYRAIAPYSRGNAPSFIPDDDDYSPLALATDVVDLLDGIGIAKAAAVVGHDWGAMVAWWLALRHPEYIEKLVIMNVPHPQVFEKFIRGDVRQIAKSMYAVFFQLPFLPENLFSVVGLSLIHI